VEHKPDLELKTLQHRRQTRTRFPSAPKQPEPEAKPTNGATPSKPANGATPSKSAKNTASKPAPLKPAVPNDATLLCWRRTKTCQFPPPKGATPLKPEPQLQLELQPELLQLELQFHPVAGGKSATRHRREWLRTGREQLLAA
jgi:hypothetical protein